MTEPNAPNPPGQPGQPETPAPPVPADRPAAAVAPETGAPLPLPRVVQSRRPRLSIVWLVPLLALAVGASLVVRSILQTGPRIEIEFRTAEGLEPGKTEVRYKEVVIGRVQAVTLRDDRQKVIAEVQLDRSAAGVAVDDTAFWVVRPRIGVGGVSGLGTLLSGAYIGVDAGKSDSGKARFVGLENPPYVLRGEPGTGYLLRAADLGSLDVGSPVYYRRTRVGRVVGYTLDAERDELSVKVFIEAPYQRLVTPQTRFWNASGVDLSLNASGLTLDTQTLTSVLAGGIAFEQPDADPRQPVAAAGTEFLLFNDRKAALAPPRGPLLPVRMVFDGSLRGLSIGAPIDFLGVEIGQVRALSLQYDAERQRAPVLVLADLYPMRLGGVRAALAKLPAGGGADGDTDTAAADRALLQRLVDQGLRAQLRTGNLLTGQLYVAMDFYPKAGPLKLKTQDGALTLPTVPGALSELQSQVGDIVQKLSRLPLDDIGRGLADTLRQAETTLKELTPETKASLAEAQRTLAAAQALLQQLGPEAQQSLQALRRALDSAQATLARTEQTLLEPGAPLQRNLEQALIDVQRAAAALRVMADTLQRHPESLLRGKPPDPALPNTRSNP